MRIEDIAVFVGISSAARKASAVVDLMTAFEKKVSQARKMMLVVLKNDIELISDDFLEILSLMDVLIYGRFRVYRNADVEGDSDFIKRIETLFEEALKKSVARCRSSIALEEWLIHFENERVSLRSQFQSDLQEAITGQIDNLLEECKSPSDFLELYGKRRGFHGTVSDIYEKRLKKLASPYFSHPELISLLALIDKLEGYYDVDSLFLQELRDLLAKQLENSDDYVQLVMSWDHAPVLYRLMIEEKLTDVLKAMGHLDHKTVSYWFSITPDGTVAKEVLTSSLLEKSA